ncbi:hypothetical protein [Parenemella sanctibonifatiensis]|uniref:Uncharacterized protein n=1 Tax=Parenemella sanctibonifatiensis TaxID=2016505 RepID=A0A255DYY6_9ACTN|nr:hypothetical protein [Parenemella sanctibonifatiensis]OYN84011.1 hypothetical protein CGZ92_13200 [Parenemella sanctibonifatiensis]
MHKYGTGPAPLPDAPVAWVAPIIKRWFTEKRFRAYDLIGVWPSAESVVMVVREQRTDELWAWRPTRDSDLDRDPVQVGDPVDPALGAPWDRVPDRDEPPRDGFWPDAFDEPMLPRLEEDTYRSASWAETTLSHLFRLTRNRSIDPHPVLAGFVEHSGEAWLMLGVDPTDGPFDDHEAWQGIALAVPSHGNFGDPWHGDYADGALSNLYGCAADLVASSIARQRDECPEISRCWFMSSRTPERIAWCEAVVGALAR